MIDITKAKKTFKEYVKNYNPNDARIKLKIVHIERTADIAKNMAKSLNLNEEDIKLAELIGLLHDIGRFEQIRKYNTFSDKNSINHGEYGAKILFEEGLIREFIEDESFDKIIKLAILNHNKDKIQEGLTERELLHAKIIRDSDKTDIFKVLLTESIESCYGTRDMTKEVITEEIFREFMEEHKINYKNMKTSADHLVSSFAFIFDFNFNYGLEIINKEKYLELIYNKFKLEDKKSQEMLNEIYKTATKNMEKRLKIR